MSDCNRCRDAAMSDMVDEGLFDPGTDIMLEWVGSYGVWLGTPKAQHGVLRTQAKDRHDAEVNMLTDLFKTFPDAADDDVSVEVDDSPSLFIGEESIDRLDSVGAVDVVRMWVAMELYKLGKIVIDNEGTATFQYSEYGWVFKEIMDRAIAG